MTEQEAIEIIWERHMDCEDYFSQYGSYPDGYDFELDQAILIAAQAIEEIQQYREIGTVEECQEAGEKQRPKKLEFYGGSEDGKLLCQNCGEDLWELKECGFTNCPYCGQAIQWDENLEGLEDE